MKKIIYIVLLLITTHSFSQINIQTQDFKITKKDSIRLANLPEVKVPKSYYQNKSPLPYMVDNSQTPYWRGIFWQGGCSCGQASSESYVYTYEVDRKRNLDASLDANRYAYSFTYNFMNIGNTICGASSIEGQDIIREAGIPNVVTYGGLSDGILKTWMTGYDKYYAAMHNRSNGISVIHVGTPEGLDLMKHWLNDHLENSPYGGMAFFYANHVHDPDTVPLGTPEGGKHIITSFSNTSHSMSIIGYNDSVRFDYNNDGQYTNDIDITGDGIVDMRDWEIGAFRIVNTYNGSQSPIVWADSGFCYVMYRVLPYHNSHGGLWDKAIYVVDPKENYEPLLTAKVNMTYDSRDKIKIMAGVSTNLSATFPDHIEEFPIFRFQGSDLYMQGGVNESDKTIEFGLDITELLNYVDSNQAAKYFLYIEEVDPAHVGSGQVNSFSIIDYTNGVNEYASSQTNVPIVDNGNTLLSVNSTINFSKVNITTDTIPRADLNNPYSTQIEATGGTEPYKWFPLYNYKATTVSNTFVPITGTVVSNTYDNIHLDFDFPFYGKNYNHGTVSRFGALMFDVEEARVPYARDYSVLYRYFKSIAPFYGESTSTTIRYEGNSSYAKIYWEAVFDGINFKYMITLFPDGTIYFDYGDGSTPTDPEWTVCLGNGDQINYQELFAYGQAYEPNTRIILEPQPFPVGLDIDDNGILSGVLTEEFPGDSLFVRVIDNNWIEHKKGFLFTDRGLLFSNYQTSTPDNNILEYGEIAHLSLDLTNVGEASINNINLELVDNDSNYSLIDSLDTLAVLNIGETVTLTNAFEFKVSEQVPDNTLLTFVVNVDADVVSASDTVSFIARAPKINIINTEIIDGNNNILDPGETADLLIYYKNTGGSEGLNLVSTYTPTDSYIVINSVTNNTRSVLNPDSVWVVTLNITVDANTPESTVSTIESDIDGDLSQHYDNNIYVGIGLITENWETGGMSSFPWGTSGNADWFVQSATVYEGNYAIQSGDINDNEVSSLRLTGTVSTSGNISFYRKVSSETDYDYLRFYIDSVMLGEWSGNLDWSIQTYPVTPGLHSFEWKYEKDVSVSVGSDAAWVDYIIFPTIGFEPSEMEVSVSSVEKYMHPNEIETDTIYVSNIGGGLMTYSATIDNASLLYNNNQMMVKNTKSIDGSVLESNPSSVYTGIPTVLEFSLTNASTDNEWIKDLTISFPLGVTLDSATAFVGGTGGPMAWDTTYGNGTDVHWHGEDSNSYGVIHGGETGTASMYLNIDPAIQNSIILQYIIDGDIYGSTPHSVTDFLVLSNNGTNDTWLTLSNDSGALISNESAELLLNFNTYGIPIGVYTCNISVESEVDTVVVPVTLHVTEYLDVKSISNTVSVYPNPATDNFTIKRTINTNESIEIYSALGVLMYSGKLENNIETISVKDWSNGLYFIRIKGENGSSINKITVY